MRRAAEGFVSALRFLTVAPLPGARLTPPSPTVTPWFPVVGLLLGWALAGLRWSLPGEGLLPAAIVVTAWTAMTGGLHEDGWADCADAALPPVSRARRLEILRDPRVGAHGLVAVLLLLLVRFAAVSDVAWWALLPPPIVGRWAMVLSLAWVPPLRWEGLGASMAAVARPGWATASAVGALALAMCVPAAGAVPARPQGGIGAAGAALLSTGAALGGGAVCGLVVGTWLSRRFGGLSGDGHGAVGLAAETGALCGLAMLGAAAASEVP